jgi:hypothetical protein
LGGRWVWSGGSDASSYSRFLTFHLWRLNQCGGVGGGGEGFAGGVFRDGVVWFASFRWWIHVFVVGRVGRDGYCRLSISFMSFGGRVVGSGLVGLSGPYSIGLAEPSGLFSVVNGCMWPGSCGIRAA